MQLYRGMDIGTAKLTEAERNGVPQHLLDIWPVTEPASVAEYQQRARSAIDELLAAGRTPILVGGADRAQQRPADRTGARGGRADRWFHRCAARPGAGLPGG